MSAKMQAELVCTTFRNVLSDPDPGTYVWDALHLNELQGIPVSALHRWLLSL